MLSVIEVFSLIEYLISAVFLAIVGVAVIWSGIRFVNKALSEPRPKPPSRTATQKRDDEIRRVGFSNYEPGDENRVE